MAKFLRIFGYKPNAVCLNYLHLPYNRDIIYMQDSRTVARVYREESPNTAGQNAG